MGMCFTGAGQALCGSLMEGLIISISAIIYNIYPDIILVLRLFKYYVQF